MNHGGFQHQALIYEGADEYLAGTMPFLRAGLEAEEPVLVAVGEAQREWIASELGSDAPRTRFVDMWEVGRNPASIIPFWRDFVEEGGGRSVRGIGEPVWADRSPPAIDECQRHEALLNVAFALHPAWSLLCPYDAGSLADEVLDGVARSHHCISRRGSSAESPSFDADPDCLAGPLPPPAAVPEVLRFELTELSEVRRRVAAAAERAGMDPFGIADLVTAASELAANSIVHGGGSGTLRLWREGEELLTEIEDRGLIEEPLVGRLRPGIAQEGGRGLWLANRLCDLVQIRSSSGGTKVRLHALVGEGVAARGCG
jgi:anti-sigma regulatory factor (Ser/Thr protein kinase)